MTFASSSLAGGDDNTEESSESLMLWGWEVVVEVGRGRSGSAGGGCEVRGRRKHHENEAN